MSTRANIIVKEGEDELWFYRHSDGYPEGAMPTLQKFMDALETGAIRDNLSQAAGWLIYFGAQEYGFHDPNREDGFSGWKVGAIEPTIAQRDIQHGDIEYLYTIDLKEKSLTYKSV